MYTALGFHDEEDAAAPEPEGDAEIRRGIERELAQRAKALVEKAVSESAAPVAMARLAARILSDVSGVDASTWAGFGSFKGLVDSWNLDPLKVITADGGAIYDPRRHTLPPPLPSGPERWVEKQLSQIIDLIRKEVAKSGSPVPCIRLASLITSQFGTIAAD